MTTLRNLFLAAMLLALASCAAAPSGAKFAKTAVPPQGKALIYVYRPDMPYGKAITIPVLMNDQKVADIANAAFFKVPVVPGDYRFVTDSASIDDPIGVTVKAGDVKFLRMAFVKHDPMGFSTSLFFTDTMRQLAEAELPSTTEEGTRYYGPKE